MKRFKLNELKLKKADFIYGSGDDSKDHVVYVYKRVAHVKAVDGSVPKRTDNAPIQSLANIGKVVLANGQFVAYTEESNPLPNAHVSIWNPYDGTVNTNVCSYGDFRAIMDDGTLCCVAVNALVLKDANGTFIRSEAINGFDKTPRVDTCGSAYAYRTSHSDIRVSYTDGRKSVTITVYNLLQGTNASFWVREGGQAVYSVSRAPTIGHRRNPYIHLWRYDVTEAERSRTFLDSFEHGHGPIEFYLARDASYILYMNSNKLRMYKIEGQHMWSMDVANELTSIDRLCWSKHSDSFMYTYRTGRSGMVKRHLNLIAKVRWFDDRSAFPRAVREDAAWHAYAAAYPLRYDGKRVPEPGQDLIMQNYVDATLLNEFSSDDDIRRLSLRPSIHALTTQ